MTVISQKLGSRLKKAAEKASEFKTTYNRIVPLVEKELGTLDQMRKELDDLARQAKMLHGELSAAHGYMKEGQQIAREHWDDLAQTATMTDLLDIWFQGDPAQIAHVLNIADEQPLTEALEKLSQKKRDFIRKILE